VAAQEQIVLPSLIDWALANREQLQLVVTTLDWPSRWASDLFDFQATIDVEGETFIGRGTATNEELALTKALAEACERAIISRQAGQPENKPIGCAVHTDPVQAKHKAALELIERSVIDFIWQNHCGSRAAHFIPARCVETAKRFYLTGIQLHFRQLNKQFGAITTLCIATGLNAKKPFGVVIGLGCARTLEESLTSAAVEVIRNVVADLEGSGLQRLSFADYKALTTKAPQHRKALGLHPETLDLCRFLIDDGTPLSDFPVLSKIVLEPIPVGLGPLTPPLFCFRAHDASVPMQVANPFPLPFG
jgi:hypothetical protein